MRKILCAILILHSLQAQEDSGVNLGELARQLRLPETELKIENVTEREREARKLPIRSAWIVSSTEDKLFFPLVVYTSRKGILNNANYDDLKSFYRDTPPGKGEFGHGLGFFDVDGVNQSLVFLEEVRISSNKPASVEGVLAPWKPNGKLGLNILGTVEEENMDLHIFLIFQDKEKIAAYPEYRSMLYGPDYPDVKELSAALVTVIRDSRLLEREEPREDKKGGTERIREGVAGGGKIEPGNDAAVEENETVAGETSNPGMNVWHWVVVLTALLIVAISFWLRKKQ